MKHNNHLDYGLTQEQADKMKLEYLKSYLLEREIKLNKFNELAEKSSNEKDSWFINWVIDELCDSITKLSKRISYYENPIKESIDIDVLKAIPILSILNSYGVRVERVGSKRLRFKLRDEKTPSCYVYEETNSWSDFGSGEGGSVLDLVMKLENKSVCEAIKILKSYL